jgi:3-hydroxyisobutyrate dehydrogenase
VGDTTEQVGFIGMGVMGAPMAANLSRAGVAVQVWNRTEGRGEEAIAAGASRCASARELAASSTIVMLCLTDSPQVDEVLFGAEGIADALTEGSLVIDFSTLSPIKAQEFATRLAEKKVGFIDAPVSGGSEGAQKATLTVMMGGSATDISRATPYIGLVGKKLNHLGAVGAGQWAKAINQVILAGTYLGVAEGVSLAVKAGLDATAVVGALMGGAADSWVLTNRSGRMIENEYPLGFKLSLHRKDLGIALGLADEVGAVIPVTSLAAGFEDELMAEGYGDDDMSALARAIRQRSGL